ncbi:ankyrin repeat-containing domain protein [Neocallimastix sp. 'constans']
MQLGEMQFANNYKYQNVSEIFRQTWNGYYINKINKNGRTFLFYACESGNKNLVKYLIELGADINKENENGKITFFMLIELGIDINKENNKCMISLFNAYENENIKNFMKYLIELGTHINNDDNNDNNNDKYRSGNNDDDENKYKDNNEDDNDHYNKFKSNDNDKQPTKKLKYYKIINIMRREV